jgi:MoaA/NifB/PqqE/SkfB family radical SAM enzyme
MCRTVMGVEDRGAEFLTLPDRELSPLVVANRSRLFDELRAGRWVLDAKPLDLVMGVASHCNIECGFCVGPKGSYGELTDARRDEVITWLPSLMSLTVSGPGEPLMSRNYLALLEDVARRAYPSLRVSLTTNGTLLTPAFLARHAAVRWSSVRISLNAGSEGTHARMTGKRLWPRVMENLDALSALRDTRDKTLEITLSCVLSEMVMGDLHRFAELVTSRGTHVVVEPMYGDMNSLSPWTRPDTLRLMAAELGAVADAYALKNPPLAKALRAVEGFARARLAGSDFTPLAHH